MLRFLTGSLTPHLRSGVPGGVYLFGPESVPIAAEIECSDEVITARGGTPEPAGVCVTVDLAGLAGTLACDPDSDLPVAPGAERGVVALQTCLLPPRERPYHLTTELARRQVMACMNRLENWELTDPPMDDALRGALERARLLLMEAVVHGGRQNGEVQAARDSTEVAAASALVLAMRVGERMAVLRAERTWSARVGGKLYSDAVARFERVQGEAPPEGAPILLPGVSGVRLAGRPLVGVSVSPARFSEQLGRAAVGASDFLVMPMRWRDIEPTEGDYRFGPTDTWIEWAVRTARVPLASGPVIDFRPGSVPDWLYIWERDYETLRELVIDHLKSVVTRYRRTIRRWTVVSGLHVNSRFPLSFEQMMDLTRMCVLVTRKLHPQASIVVEVAQPWGEYFALNRKSVPPIVYAEMLAQQQIRIDALGVRLQMGQGRPGQTTRDIGAISEMLDRLSEIERPVIVTAAGAPSAEHLSQPVGKTFDAPPEGMTPGRWDGPWDEQAQARWLRAVLGVALSKPYVHSVCWQDLYDTPGDPEMPAGGLVNASGVARPALAALVGLKRAVIEGALDPTGRVAASSAPA